MPVDGVHVARRSGEPDVPAGASRCCLPGAMPNGQCLRAERLRVHCRDASANLCTRI